MAGKKSANTTTPAGRIDVRKEAADLFRSGRSVEEIQKKLNICRATVYNYITVARIELLKQKKEHFNERLALWLDDSLNTIGVQHGLLGDREFLTTAEPERITAINNSIGILSDKCLLLLAASASLRPQSQQQALAAGFAGNPAVAGIAAE